MVLFDSRDIKHKNPFGAVPSGADIAFMVKVTRGLGVSCLNLMVAADGQEPKIVPMRWTHLEGSFDVYTVSLRLDLAGLYWYHFQVAGSLGTKYVGKAESGRAGELQDAPGTSWQLTVYDWNYQTPDWFKGGVMYQIFVDRFSRGEGGAEPDPMRGQYLRSDWGGTPEYKALPNGDIPNRDFFGGNLYGIIEKLDYLSELGVTCIYLNPIFRATSNHKYDTGDYAQIDPMFGDEKAFQKLCREAANRGMHVILDGVFNHTGSDSIYFNKEGLYPEVGAYQSKESPYYSWYHFGSWPDEYLSWWGVKILPSLNEMLPAVLEFLVKGRNSVIRRWLRSGASGWRLDVADELPDEFIALLRQASKEEKADALVIGEVWEDASNKVSYGQRRRYLLGNELDGVMNYPWRDAILTYIMGGNAEDLCESVQGILENYPPPAVGCLMNSLGTHDTPRILTVLGGPPAFMLSRDHQAEYRMSSEERQWGIQCLKLAVAIYMTLPGVPCIYYGDEAGMEGYGDPFNRRGFAWGNENLELLAWHRKFGQLRKQSPALKEGSFVPGRCHGAVFAFERRSREERLLVAVNRSDVAEEACFEGGHHIRLEPWSAQVLTINNK